MKREYLSREKGIIVRNQRKGKLKTKELLKITILEEQETTDNQQAEPKQCKFEIDETCIYQNLERGRHSIYI